MSKSYVGMSDCFFCGQTKELLLDRWLRESLPNRAVYNKEPCEICKEYMKQGVILISVSEKLTGENKENPYRTGGWVVVTDEGVKRMLEGAAMLDDILKFRVSFITDEAWQALGLPYGDVKLGDPGYER